MSGKACFTNCADFSRQSMSLQCHFLYWLQQHYKICIYKTALFLSECQLRDNERQRTPQKVRLSYSMCMRAKSPQSCPTLYNTMDYSPLGSSFHGQEYRNGLPCPLPGDLPFPGIKPASHMSPALACQLSNLGKIS